MQQWGYHDRKDKNIRVMHGFKQNHIENKA